MGDRRIYVAEEDGIMGTFTWSTGLGMLAVGLAVMFVGAIIIWKIINHKPKKEKYGE